MKLSVLKNFWGVNWKRKAIAAHIKILHIITKYQASSFGKKMLDEVQREAFLIFPLPIESNCEQIQGQRCTGERLKVYMVRTEDPVGLGRHFWVAFSQLLDLIPKKTLDSVV